MELNIVTLIVAVVALLVGIIAGKFIFAKDTKKKVDEAEQHAQHLIKEAELRAETVRKEKELAAKEKFVQLKSEHDKEVLERNRKLGESENRIRQKSGTKPKNRKPGAADQRKHHHQRNLTANLKWLR
jgi:ribonuclease Y